MPTQYLYYIDTNKIINCCNEISFSHKDYKPAQSTNRSGQKSGNAQKPVCQLLNEFPTQNQITQRPAELFYSVHSAFPFHSSHKVPFHRHFFAPFHIRSNLNAIRVRSRVNTRRELQSTCSCNTKYCIILQLHQAPKAKPVIYTSAPKL